MRYKDFLDLKLSEIGVGTYLGNIDEETDKNYFETIKLAIEKGINVIDTAINYRNMRSEIVIGKVIKEIDRKKVIISTKGGYIAVPPDIKDASSWFKKELVEKGIIQPQDITQTGNIITAKYIDWAFNKSLENLNTNYIDVYFLHNPEDQLLNFDRETFYKKLRNVFRLLEGKVNEGKLRYYGLATWNGFRVLQTEKQYLNLKDIYDIATDTGGENHHFRFIQLPYNMAMPEAYTLKNQNIDGKNLSTLEACEKLNIYTYISASLMQTRILGRIPENILKKLGVEKQVHAAIQFVRSTKGVGTALIGMSKKEHLLENLEIENINPLKPEEIDNLFKEPA
ncbi:aldo/keto reductase [Hydrogenothermus marinus]|uniref:Aryl-alcohol dehydrogenase-like predicted oxidoreductase n=1 Tax=Hydrogenothermus marinus TaxID=133270 RepID=A0A3M0BKM9_9AQUI|nr:aldo/keto reductase [Hydrogenothermus marinus]RMA97791.1 aryl-alcohol dehydrogenase-like predicted oxidoreductase [Hydrogenothermus marinus]